MTFLDRKGPWISSLFIVILLSLLPSSGSWCPSHTSLSLVSNRFGRLLARRPGPVVSRPVGTSSLRGQEIDRGLSRRVNEKSPSPSLSSPHGSDLTPERLTLHLRCLFDRVGRVYYPSTGSPDTEKCLMCLTIHDTVVVRLVIKEPRYYPSRTFRRGSGPHPGAVVHKRRRAGTR